MVATARHILPTRHLWYVVHVLCSGLHKSATQSRSTLH